MKIIQLSFFCWIVVQTVNAQQHKPIEAGSITYERSVNTFAIIKKIVGNNDQVIARRDADNYLKSQEQFKTQTSTLFFDGKRTLFVPDQAADRTTVNMLGDLPFTEQTNTIYRDFNANLVMTRKTFFEQKFLISDTARKISWKIKDETREIAGYSCRRANAVILDSIYVVAFYTDAIHLPGGPESFSGLPGVILEVALPHNNVIWRATKITAGISPISNIVPPKDGKIITRRVYESIVRELYKGKETTGRNQLLILSEML